MKSVFADARNFQQFLCQKQLFFGLYITLQVMAVTEMSPAYQGTVTALFQGFNNKHRINTSGTHDAHCPEIRRILQP
jgi:hypothetical protein